MAAGREMSQRSKLATTLAALLFIALPAAAAPGDEDNGERLYGARCLGCHGEEGDGLGPGAERLNPPPRDLTQGQYKFKTTAFDDIVPNDQDLFRMIRDGMPGSAMPSWGDVLSKSETWDLVAFIKTFAGLEEEEPSAQIDYGAQVASSAESIAEGRRLFLEDERCSECHGAAGRGDGIKKLKDDNGARTWPRNLTKPWTFRASNDPRDIFSRISGGIPTTQMPSFADPISKKKLGIEERWHVANYVASLAETVKVVRPENIVIRAAKLDGEIPASLDDPRWAESIPATFFLVPQIIVEQRFFTSSNDTITVRALYNDEEVAFLLEWDDRTKSLPGDPQAEKVSEPELSPDAVAVQLPVTIPETMEKPYFVMGDAARPVNLWRWSSGGVEEPESVALIDGRGVKKLKEREDGGAGLRASGTYDKGAWRVLMRRALTTADPDNDLQFMEGKFIPIAFAAWDGSNGEKGTKHTLTTWYWLLLAPSTGAWPLVVALIVAALIAAAELWWLKSASAKA